MHRLRRSTVRATVVGLMLATLLPVIGAPYAGVADRSAAEPGLEWLRRQLRLPADDAYDRAVEVALSAQPKSLAELVEVFLSAYGAEAADFEPARSLGLSPIPFGQFLTGRFLQLMAPSVLDTGRVGKTFPTYRFTADGFCPSIGAGLISAIGAFAEVVAVSQLIQQILAAKPLGP